MFITQLEQLSKKKRKTLSNILKELEINPSSATNWRKGATINSDMLTKLANYFNVSTDYILGRTDTKEPTYNIENHSSMYGDVKHNENNIESLKPLEVEMLSHFRKLSIKEQLKAIERLINDEE